MANPNIGAVSTILATTAVANVTTVQATLVENTAASGLVYKINTLLIANIDGTNPADITVALTRSSVDYSIASTVTVPADATLVVVGKENYIYLNEGDALKITASANGDLQAVCSYEVIS